MSTPQLKCDEILTNIIHVTGKRALNKKDIENYTGMSKYKVTVLMKGVPKIRNTASTYAVEHVAKVLTGTYRF